MPSKPAVKAEFTKGRGTGAPDGDPDGDSGPSPETATSRATSGVIASIGTVERDIGKATEPAATP